MKEPLLYRIVRPIIKLLFNLFYQPKIIGLENINIKGKLVFAGNHTSYLDCLLLISATKRVIHFLAKDSLNKGAKKIIFKNMGIIPVNREHKDRQVLDISHKCLINNMVVCVFPEGTINRTDKVIMPFKIGAVKMAHDANAPLVPFTITGKYKFFGGIRLEFLPSINICGDLSIENEKLMHLIKDNLERNNNEINK